MLMNGQGRAHCLTTVANISLACELHGKMNRIHWGDMYKWRAFPVCKCVREHVSLIKQRVLMCEPYFRFVTGSMNFRPNYWSLLGGRLNGSSRRTQQPIRLTKGFCQTKDSKSTAAAIVLKNFALFLANLSH